MKKLNRLNCRVLFIALLVTILFGCATQQEGSENNKEEHVMTKQEIVHMNFIIDDIEMNKKLLYSKLPEEDKKRLTEILAVGKEFKTRKQKNDTKFIPGFGWIFDFYCDTVLPIYCTSECEQRMYPGCSMACLGKATICYNPPW